MFRLGPLKNPWLHALVLCFAFGAITLALKLPQHIVRGEKGQRAIQMLDAMRPPFLAVKEAEVRFLATGDKIFITRDFTKASESANSLLAQYKQLASYNPELSKHVAELAQVLEDWLAAEQNLFTASPDPLSDKENQAGEKHTHRWLNAAAAGFLSTMTKLGEGEESLHDDIGNGRRATRIILPLLGFSFFYMLGLVFFKQRARRRTLERSRDELELQVRMRTASLQDANRDLKRQKEIQELLKELSQDITRLDVDSLLKKLTERVREVFKVDICDVRVRDEEVWKVMGVSGIEPKKTQSDSTATARGRSRWILDNRRPLLIHDITKTGQFSGGESIRKVGVRGYIGVPIFARGGDVIGILRALTYGPRETSPEEVDLLQLMANGTGIALENAKLLEHIRQQAQTLEQANRQQADFTAMIAHDLRSPLTNVIGIAEMMKDDMLGPVNEEQKKWLGKIGANVRNLVNLVSDFLDLSKLEAGHIELTKKLVYIEELIENNLESYQLLGQDKKITFTISLDLYLPTIDADPRRLGQVLSNLLSNAVKFTPEGGQIEVGARVADSRSVNFWVRDTGIGIPKEEIGNLFEKYKQASNTKNGSYEGTGLGLVICKMIVETHGGRIWIDSEEEKGTTVFVSLPVAPGPQLQADAPPSSFPLKSQWHGQS